MAVNRCLILGIREGYCAAEIYEVSAFFLCPEFIVRGLAADVDALHRLTINGLHDYYLLARRAFLYRILCRHPIPFMSAFGGVFLPG